VSELVAETREEAACCFFYDEVRNPREAGATNDACGRIVETGSPHGNTLRCRRLSTSVNWSQARERRNREADSTVVKGKASEGKTPRGQELLRVIAR
jgi:hypothetical protein